MSISTLATIFKRRSVFVTTAVIDMLLIGICYAWSLFLAPIEAEMGFSRESLTVAYTINMCSYSLGNLLSSFLNKRLDFRRVLMLGGCTLGVGYVLSGKANSLAALCLSYGLLCGTANGMLFNTLVNAVLRFFDKNISSVTGMLLLTLGMSNTLLSPVLNMGIQFASWRAVFVTIGTAGFILCVLGAAVCPKGNPPPALPRFAGQTKQNPLSILGNRLFLILCLWSMIFSMLGQSYIGQAAACGLDNGATIVQSGLVVGLLSAFNGIGRLAFGRYYDLRSNQSGMRILCASYFLGFASLSAGTFAHELPFIYVGTALTGLGYGGLIITYATVVRTYFGNESYSMNLSLLNMTTVPANIIGSALINNVRQTWGGYQYAFVLFCVFALANFFLTSVFKSNRRR